MDLSNAKKACYEKVQREREAYRQSLAERVRAQIAEYRARGWHELADATQACLDESQQAD